MGKSLIPNNVLIQSSCEHSHWTAYQSHMRASKISAGQLVLAESDWSNITGAASQPGLSYYPNLTVILQHIIQLIVKKNTSKLKIEAHGTLYGFNDQTGCTTSRHGLMAAVTAL